MQQTVAKTLYLMKKVLMKLRNAGENTPIRLQFPYRRHLDIIGGKYKVSILYNLRNGALRFGQLRRLVRKPPNAC